MNAAREEVNRLLSQAYQAAELMLSRGRGFDPFSLVMGRGGGIRIINAVLDPTQPSTIDQRVGYAQRALRKMAEEGEAKATAFIAMMQLRLAGREGYTDAVVLEIEHQDDGAVNFYVPYEWQGDRPVLGEPIAKRRTPTIFVPGRGPAPPEDESALRQQAEAFLRKPVPEGVEFNIAQGSVQNFLSGSVPYPRGAVWLNRAAATVLRRPTEGASPAAEAYRAELADLLERIADHLERSAVPGAGRDPADETGSPDA